VKESRLSIELTNMTEPTISNFLKRIATIQCEGIIEKIKDFNRLFDSLIRSKSSKQKSQTNCQAA
jgi:hypothetical protein